MARNNNVEPPKPKPGNKPKPTPKKKSNSKSAAKKASTSTYKKHLHEARKHQRAAERAKKKADSVERYDQVEKGKTSVIENEQKNNLPPNLQEDLKDRDVIFQPNPGPQTDFLASTEREVFYGGARGGGKASWVESQVATPFGFRRMGDIKPGHKVCAPDGTTAKVMFVHPQGVQDIYKVTTCDGGETYVTLDHLWLVSLVGNSYSRKKTTNQLIKELENGRSVTIPVSNELPWVKNGRYNTRTVDPYVLGVLLGDGCLRQNTISFTSADDEIVSEVKERLPEYTIKKSGSYTYRIVWCKPLKDKLKKLGVYGCLSDTKFIPDTYLYGTLNQRQELLAGLMDTDGTCDVDGRIGFTTVSNQLAKDVQFLARSLGAKATITEKTTTHQLAYTVYISIDQPVFKLPRKQSRQNLTKHVWRTIKSIEYYKRDYAQCITVDHPSSLYITDDFIVTHNSYAMLVDPLRFVENENHRALILRRTMPELRQLILESQKLYKRAYPGARWKEQDKLWKFPSGAQIEFGYAENYQDVMRYQGQSYTWIGVDELPQFPDESIWQFLRSCLRSTDPNLPVYMRATGNPGNIGSMWVKEKFIDPAPPNQRFTESIEIDTPQGRRTEQITRRFIPAKVWDNPYLTYDNHYVGMLATLPESQRRQYLEGDWSAFDNAAFPEFDRPKGTHVVEPFEVPKGWLKFRAADWGYSSPACCLWFAIDFDNNLWVYREYYTKKETADEFAKNVLELEKEDGQIRYGVLDSSVWAQRGETGPSIAETMIRNGCFWRPADRSPKSRVNGKLELHRRLSVNPTTGEPGLRVFSNCRNLIRTLPMLPLDDKNPEDVDTDTEDHAYDALRYGCMSRPINPNNIADDWGSNMTPRPPVATADDTIFGY